MIKGLEALRKALKHTTFVFYGKGNIEEQTKEYSDNLSLVEKELKAFNVITNKSHKFNVGWDDLLGYYFEIDGIRFYISKEEYELLKEVLKNERY